MIQNCSSFSIFPCHFIKLLPQKKVVFAPRRVGTCLDVCFCTCLCTCFIAPFVYADDFHFFHMTLLTSLRSFLILLFLGFVKINVLFHLLVASIKFFLFLRYDSTCLGRSETFYLFLFLAYIFAKKILCCLFWWNIKLGSFQRPLSKGLAHFKCLLYKAVSLFFYSSCELPKFIYRFLNPTSISAVDIKGTSKRQDVFRRIFLILRSK